ncbi:autoinducer-2 kinase [Psychrobacillus soli]|uniref:Autoinducer-2 kinase n=1 Tax=Psychrobacillus soli TaxID=1543965 RepID=A0A544TJ45_9BACI|nr:autoinducer-2 kinase [Psychrobacillus soli]TQR17467.1 autoinducer-2 kinase [Psychrobacillus soli]
MAFLLAFDAGTGSIRAVLFNENGEQVCVAQQAWTHLPDSNYPGSMNFDYTENWKIIVQCIREVLTKAAISPTSIKAVSATSMREGFVLYDESGREIWACANVDARAGQEVEALKRQNSDLEYKSYKLSGQTFALGAVPRLMWLKNNQPEIYEKVSAITMINDWILYKLSGVLQADPSNGCTTGLFDLTRRNWSDEITDLYDIDKEMFSTVNEAGTVIGHINGNVAKLTGLSEETLVVAGGGDAQLASVGVGAIENGQAIVSGGSFWQQELNIDKPIYDVNSRIRINCHAIQDLWQIETIAFFPGLVVQWFRDSFCDKEVEESKKLGKNFYELMEEKMKDVPAGSYGVIPIFSDVMNYISWRHAAPSFINLSLDPEKSGKHVLFRALQENAAMVTLGNFKIIEEVTGHYPKEIIFAGGASNSKLWTQILADMLGIPVKVPEIKEAAALGTALYAGVGAGIFDNISDVVQKVVKFESVFIPNMEHHQLYQELYKTWRSVYVEQLKLADKKITEHMWRAPGLTI